MLPLSCCLSLSLVLPRSRCPLPVLPLSCAPSLSPALSRFDSTRTLLDKLKNKSGRLNKNLVQKSPRAPSLSSCLLLSLLLVGCLSRAASRTCALSLVAGRRRWPMGPTLESGGALYWLTGLGAREGTVLLAHTAIETATTARAAAPILAAPAPSIAQQSVACPPSPSLALSLSCALNRKVAVMAAHAPGRDGRRAPTVRSFTLSAAMAADREVALGRMAAHPSRPRWPPTVRSPPRARMCAHVPSRHAR